MATGKLIYFNERLFNTHGFTKEFPSLDVCPLNLSSKPRRLLNCAIAEKFGLPVQKMRGTLMGSDLDLKLHDDLVSLTGLMIQGIAWDFER